jgi:2-polyprenyl-3-methyl-5-hydroxy-6-metoxy-1,4-benzoquinol methylase
MAYETNKARIEYLDMHFGAFNLDGKSIADATDFPLQCAQECALLIKENPNIPSIALDVGCAVGRAAFELARHFEQVVGIDYSHSFIDTANALKQLGSLEYQALEEGEITSTKRAQIDPSIVSFTLKKTIFLIFCE